MVAALRGGGFLEVGGRLREFIMDHVELQHFSPSVSPYATSQPPYNRLGDCDGCTSQSIRRTLSLYAMSAREDVGLLPYQLPPKR